MKNVNIFYSDDCIYLTTKLNINKSNVAKWSLKNKEITPTPKDIIDYLQFKESNKNIKNKQGNIIETEVELLYVKYVKYLIEDLNIIKKDFEEWYLNKGINISIGDAHRYLFNKKDKKNYMLNIKNKRLEKE